jgi:hypothetical protein
VAFVQVATMDIGLGLAAAAAVESMQQSDAATITVLILIRSFSARRTDSSTVVMLPKTPRSRALRYTARARGGGAHGGIELHCKGVQ